MRLDIHVYHHLAGGDEGELKRLLTQVLAGQERANMGVERIEVELERLSAVTTGMATSLEAVVAKDAEEDAAYQAEIDRLKAIIEAGGTVTQEQLDALADVFTSRNEALQAVADSLKAIGEDPEDPLPEPVPEEGQQRKRKR